MRRAGTTLATGSIAACAVLLLSASRAAPTHATAYGAELAQIDQRLGDAATPGKVAYLLYTRASLTTDFDDFKRAERAIDAAVENGEALDELLFLRANFNLKMHRLKLVRDDLETLRPLGESAQFTALEADVDLQEGLYETAIRGYRRAVEQDPTWDNIARVAYYTGKTGDPQGADRLYAEAQNEISAKELRSYAWVELQRGVLKFDNGDYAGALTNYRRADRAYSGYWLIQEHIAEALNHLGRTQESLAVYDRVIRDTGNPEFINAKAAIVAKHDPATARALYKQTARLYEKRFAVYPEAAIGHAITDLINNIDTDPRLLTLAQRNVDLRPNAEAKLLLAKAYLKSGDNARAHLTLTDVVTNTPWRTPELARLVGENR
jgi:tetratricopeptide (TPR) repeat protein